MLRFTTVYITPASVVCAISDHSDWGEMDIYISLMVSKLKVFFLCLLAICTSYFSNCLLIVLVSLLIVLYFLFSFWFFGCSSGWRGRGPLDRWLSEQSTCSHNEDLGSEVQCPHKKSWHDGAWLSSQSWSTETGVCQGSMAARLANQ